MAEEERPSDRKVTENRPLPGILELGFEVEAIPLNSILGKSL
jgi:hypothetical protein